MGDSAELAVRYVWTLAGRVGMNAHHIDRFGSSTGSSGDRPRIPRRTKRRPDAGAGEFAQLLRSDGPQERRAWSTELGVVRLSDGAGEVAAAGDQVT